MDFADRIVELRDSRELTQKQLVAKILVSVKLVFVVMKDAAASPLTTP